MASWRTMLRQSKTGSDSGVAAPVRSPSPGVLRPYRRDSSRCRRRSWGTRILGGTSRESGLARPAIAGPVLQAVEVGAAGRSGGCGSLSRVVTVVDLVETPIEGGRAPELLVGADRLD